MLKKAIAPILDDYDYIIIDCAPSLGLLTLNALTSADSVIIPIQCEYYALEGLSSLLNTIEQVRDSVNPGLEVFGILRTMFDPRINLSNEVSMQLIEHFDSDAPTRAAVARGLDRWIRSTNGKVATRKLPP